jgi:predicted nucleic acid-binding protein
VEEAKAIRTLILDTNVLISSLVRSEGITRTCLTILLHDDNCKVTAPAGVVEELKKHIDEICDKSGIARPLLEDALDRLLENIDLAPASLYANELHEALRFVRDGSDAPFAALSVIRSPSTIITYNKKHFNSRRLLRRQVRVRTPVEVVRELD